MFHKSAHLLTAAILALPFVPLLGTLQSLRRLDCACSFFVRQL
jgi:hypothetical protein